MKLKKFKQGFTLTEILIVMSIIVILAVIGIMSYLNNVKKAHDATRKSDLSKLSTAIEGYYADHECYPDVNTITNCGSDGLKPYIDSIPCDPVYKDNYCYFVSEESPASCWQGYHLLTTLENKSDSEIAKLGCDGPGYCGWETECRTVSTRFGFNYGVASSNLALINAAAAAIALPTPISINPGLPDPGGPGSYACTKMGVCDNFDTVENAVVNHECPITFTDPSICQLFCNNSKIYWCAI